MGPGPLRAQGGRPFAPPYGPALYICPDFAPSSLSQLTNKSLATLILWAERSKARLVPSLTAKTSSTSGPDMPWRSTADVMTQLTTAWCSTQVVDITQVKHRSTHITSLRVVQQKHMRVQGMSIEVQKSCLHKINTTSYFTVR